MERGRWHVDFGALFLDRLVDIASLGRVRTSRREYWNKDLISQIQRDIVPGFCTHYVRPEVYDDFPIMPLSFANHACPYFTKHQFCNYQH